MDGISYKRLRCDDLETFEPQRKKFITTKLVDGQQPDVMASVYAKTLDKLLSGARINKATLHTTALTPSTTAKAPPLWEQIILSGNGEITSRNLTDLTTDLSMEQHKWDCCHRQVYIRSNCLNCGQKMCEYCGHSCAECCAFLCDSCVSLFGCGNIDHPICDKCSLFQDHT